MDYQHYIARDGKNEDGRSAFRTAAVRFVRIAVLSLLCVLPDIAGAESLPALKNVEFQKKVILIPALGTQSPMGDISLSLLEAKNDPELQTLLSSLVYKGLSSRAFSEECIRDFEKRYAEAGRSLAEQGEQPRASYNWYYHERTDFVSAADGLLVLKHRRENYEGGAHGNTEEQYLVLDIREHRLLALTDLMKDSSFPALSKLIMDKLRASLDLKAGEPLSKGGLFEDFVAPSSDFFLNAQGIGFHWNPYEIAPYVFGHKEVIIPYGEADALLSNLGQSARARFSASTKR
jgi:hypothetical protein